LFEMARAINRFIDQERLEETKEPSATLVLQEGMKILREISALLGLFLKPVPKTFGNDTQGQLVDGLMELVLRLRTEARARRDFATSDAVRDGLNTIGIAIQDGKQGTTWQVKSPTQ